MLPQAVEGAEGEMRFRCALSLLVGMFIAMPARSEPQLNVIKLKLANSGGRSRKSIKTPKLSFATRSWCFRGNSI